MKKFYLILASVFLLNFAIAAPVITAVSLSGSWNSNATWDLGRTPQSGDTVVIPAGKKVVINSNVNLGSSTIYLKVLGTLEINGGKIDLNNSSSIYIASGATIISSGSNSEQIKIGGTIKYKGSEGIVAGPALSNASTAAAPSGFAALGSGALPVKFLGFNVARQNNNVIVDWSTAQEINSKYFEVQRSENGNTWTTIATVDAAGNSFSIQKYSYTDRSVSADVVYYRIRQVDIDARYDITAVRTVKMQGGSLEVKISSGTANNFYMHFSEQVKSVVTVKILSKNGQVVDETKLSKPIGQQTVAVKNNLKGIYIVTVNDNNGFQTSSQVLF
jgi:hypothetical protein